MLKLGMVNCFFIQDTDGFTLVDTGYAGSSDKIFDAVRAIGKRPDSIQRIILTHSHPDHAGSASSIQQALEIPVWAHQEDAELLRAGVGGRAKNLAPGIANWIIYQLYIKNTPNKVEPVEVERNLKDGEVLPIAGGLRVIHSPGHSQGHIALLLEKESMLIAGDICAHAAGLGYSVVNENIGVARQSLLKVAGYPFEGAVFGHGKPLKSGASKAIQAKFSKPL